MASYLDDMFRKVNQTPVIKKALQARAEKVKARATAISRAADGTANYSIKSGTRPGGRAYVDVVSDNSAEEFGTEKVRRIGALRRAVRGE